jgi:hypothetical protein
MYNIFLYINPYPKTIVTVHYQLLLNNLPLEAISSVPSLVPLQAVKDREEARPQVPTPPPARGTQMAGLEEMAPCSISGSFGGEKTPTVMAQVIPVWLVVWNMTFMTSIYGMSSFPLTNSYFSRLVDPPTSSYKYL